jgi:hypothetical protein
MPMYTQENDPDYYSVNDGTLVGVGKNDKSMRSILINCLNTNMNDSWNCIRFLERSVTDFKLFTIVIPVAHDRNKIRGYDNVMILPLTLQPWFIKRAIVTLGNLHT